jgi:hypothetical protein
MKPSAVSKTALPVLAGVSAGMVRSFALYWTISGTISHRPPRFSTRKPTMLQAIPPAIAEWRGLV